MGTRRLLTITAALLLLFGCGFILLPRLVFSIYGVALDPGGIMLARVAGAAIFSLGTLAWLGRKTSIPGTTRVVVLALCCFFVIKSVVTLIAQLSGVFNGLGWSILLIDVPLAVLYARELLHGPAAKASLSLQ